MLGLLVRTDPQWVEEALAHFDAVLVDHLHCELKAASNAIALVARYPTQPGLVHELTSLAQEELGHVRQVHDELERRGIRAHPPDPDPYALALRRASGAIARGNPLLDRLAVATLIEARSCERFSLLRDHAPDETLRTWYAGLFESEARHARLFASLAEDVAGKDAARDCIARLAEREAEIVGDLPRAARMH